MAAFRIHRDSDWCRNSDSESESDAPEEGEGRWDSKKKEVDGAVHEDKKINTHSAQQKPYLDTSAVEESTEGTAVKKEKQKTKKIFLKGPFVSAWTCLDPITESNGSFTVFPGSHFRQPSNKKTGEMNVDGSKRTRALSPKILDGDKIRNENDSATKEAMEKKGIRLLLPEGTLVFMANRLLHGSGGNSERFSRRAWMPQFGLTPILKLRVDKGGSTYDLNDLKYAKLNSENVQNIDKENYDLASLAVPLQEAFS